MSLIFMQSVKVFFKKFLIYIFSKLFNKSGFGFCTVCKIWFWRTNNKSAFNFRINKVFFYKLLYIILVGSEFFFQFLELCYRAKLTCTGISPYPAFTCLFNNIEGIWSPPAVFFAKVKINSHYSRINILLRNAFVIKSFNFFLKKCKYFFLFAFFYTSHSKHPEFFFELTVVSGVWHITKARFLDCFWQRRTVVSADYFAKEIFFDIWFACIFCRKYEVSCCPLIWSSSFNINWFLQFIKSKKLLYLWLYIRKLLSCIRNICSAVIFLLKTIHIFFIKEIKLFGCRNITIKEKTAVIRAVEGFMECKKIFIRERRNYSRISTRRKSRIWIWIHCFKKFVICNLIEGCKVSLHFVVNNTLNA